MISIISTYAIHLELVADSAGQKRFINARCNALRTILCNGPNLTASDFQNYVSYLNTNWHQCTLTSNHLLYSKRLIQVLVINNDKDIVNVQTKIRNIFKRKL